ncbi:drug resistance transporter, EmrB/QacA subfamily [Faunimonas pinastri]|uniref:Drug resistance transporter, EmrB/QacA subfamily n=1 Tax=Faunimonas pinastri TaxID=1855383 RepID=A0A1H9AMR0_9HYPH|nr:MDR family MFS transporter [Faunimonas pinastri]SEP77673.1 drug resistance transporter, EmrB/QacA subfamily [Faunimonas pinastri]
MNAPHDARPSAGPLSPAEIRSIIWGIMLAMFLAALDQTIVATALPTIGHELGDLQHMPWVVTAYLLTATAVTPLYGKFSDIHGRRVTLLIGIATFVMGSIACALAPTMLVLILARALQGLGGGGLISLAQTIIADILAPKERGKYQVYIASVFVASSLAGPVLGGVFAEHLHWSVIFWINVPLGLMALWLANGALKHLPRNDRRHELDILGAVLVAAATVAFMLMLNWGGVTYPWLSTPVIGLLVLSAILSMLFGLRLRMAAEPLIPPSVLANPIVRMGTLAASFCMGTFIGLTIYTPIYFETVVGLSASDSGMAVIPLMIGTVIGANLSGRAMSHSRHYKRMPTAGLLVAVVGCLLLFARPTGLHFVVVEAVLFVLSMGLGTLLPVATVSVQNAVASHQLGTATASMNFFRQLGSAVIVAVFGAIVLGQSGALGSVGGSVETLARTAAMSQAGGVFRWVFLAAAIGFALAWVFLLLMEEKPLRSDDVRNAAHAALAD